MRCSINQHSSFGNSRARGPLLILVAFSILASSVALAKSDGIPNASVEYSEDRKQCANRNPLRNVYFGDLHVHTGYSLDAYAFGTDTSPNDAYRFAKGEPLELMPYDDGGNPTRSVTIDQPLDFMAVTDHAEFLGELLICHDPAHESYATARCRAFRFDRSKGWGMFSGRKDEDGYPTRSPEVCGKGANKCKTASRKLWGKIIDAANTHYDRSTACTFTTFIGYEHTAMPNRSNLHRNVIFRNDTVPAEPITAVDVPKDYMIWKALKKQCKDRLQGCDVIAIPHNPNLSNGKLISDYYEDSKGIKDEKNRARLRNEIEPLVEIFQHKGNSECRNGLSGVIGEPDELCNFEQVRKFHDGFYVGHLTSKRRFIPPTQDCNGEVGEAGQIGGGCVSSNDFIRGSLLTGLKEEKRLGVNPLKFGVIASTDTHNSAGGQVKEAGWKGSWEWESSPELRQQDGNFRRTKAQGSAGGLAGVWAVENSRDAIFDAMKRRETFGTSGPRISPRFFGGWNLDQAACRNPDVITYGYKAGVPMGGDIKSAPADAAPSFITMAARDPASDATQLQRLQVIKGWISEEGEAHYKVFDVAGEKNDAGVDTETGMQHGDGHDMLCSIFTDPEFDPARPAYYYMRAVENPSLRWSWAECLQYPEEERTQKCNQSAPKSIQELAWTSPIWYRPPE